MLFSLSSNNVRRYFGFPICFHQNVCTSIFCSIQIRIFHILSFFRLNEGFLPISQKQPFFVILQLIFSNKQHNMVKEKGGEQHGNPIY